jgi:ZIP family zinc transporter
MHTIEEMDQGKASLPKDARHDFEKLKRAGMLSALAIAIHNFPEGLATFTAALSDPALGVAIAVAIAVHNVPEGMAVSVPIYYATGSRKKAFKYSFLSGVSEPVGALVGYLLLMPFFTPAVFGVLFASVAGIMVYISLDQLLPSAEEYGEHHLCIAGVVAGMAVMALSLLLFL